jgi:hypothetical protein
MTDLLRPDDLRKITTDTETAKVQEYLLKAKKQEEEQAQLREAFLEKDVHPQVKDRLNAAIRRAAEQGLNEIQVLVFPSTYCNDSGRRINNNDNDWPSTLEGFAKRAYDYFDKELRPLGFRLRAQIIDFPGGIPGNVGMFLRW